MTSGRGLSARLLVLVTGLTLLVAACGQEEPGGTGEDDTGGPGDVPQFSTIEAGVLQIGSCLDYKPFEFVKNGEEMGFDVELAEEIARRLELKPQWVTSNFDTIFTSLAAGEFDMVAAAATITEERLAQVDFSMPYFNARQGFTVDTEATPDLESVDDLEEGDVVGVQKGTTGKDWAEENLAPRGIEIKTFDAAPDAFSDLEAGGVVGVVNDEGSSIAEAESRPGLEVVQAIDTNEYYGFALSKDNPELSKGVNVVLKEIIEDGTYEEIFKEWFPDLPVPEEYQPA